MSWVNMKRFLRTPNFKGGRAYQDFRRYYDLEPCIFGEVQVRFEQEGYLLAFDFFCIVIWKANRAKSKIAKRLTSMIKLDLL